MPPNILFIQPAIPSYRVGFFSRLHQSIGCRLSIYAADSPLNSSDISAKFLSESPWVRTMNAYQKLPLGLYWNHSLANLAIRRHTIYVLSGNPRDVTTVFLLFRLILSKRRDIKVVWWTQYWSHGSHPIQQLVKLILAFLCDAICFYTDVEVLQFKQIPLLGSKKLVTALSNGLDYDRISSFRCPYVPKSRYKSILFIGRVAKKSNLILLLEALSSPLIQDVLLHVIGDGDLRETAQEMTLGLSISNRITWHGELHDEFDLSKIANSCLLSVYPGPVGLSAIHALSYGLPMIIHDNPKHHGPEHCAVIPLITGELFNEGSAKSLSLAISSLINDDSRLITMSANALKITSAQYTTAVMADRFHHLVKSFT